MKKLFVILLFLISLLTTGWKHDRGIVLFNTQPINAKNVLTDAKVFQSGQRVYYLFLAPKKMKNEYIRVQVFKMTDKAPWGGYEVLRTKDHRLMKGEQYYHMDYFVMHQPGRYVLQVFSMDDLQHPLSLNDFYVK